jgi:hydroxymethylpyrimidine/phosphomethylpyrimidine kinase
MKMAPSTKPRRTRPISVVTIAGSDSGGGAGIQADLLTLAAHGVFGTTVITAGTAQSTVELTGIETFSTGFLRKQLDAVFSDFRPKAVKIGMLFDAPRVRTVAEGLRRHRAGNIVLDPVMVAKTGVKLLTDRTRSSILKHLFPLCDLVTPNLPEAEALTGIRIRTRDDYRRVASLLLEHGARAVLIKGGHSRTRTVLDLLYDGQRFTEFEAERIRTRATHGTGCTLSSAIAANLALGRSLEESIARSTAYLQAGLRNGLFPGRGFGIPDHFAGP